MARRKAGFMWKMLSGDGGVQTHLLIPAAAANPVGGDLCGITTAPPAPNYAATGVAALVWLCAEGITEFDALNIPGQHANVGTDWDYAQFGGSSARDADSTTGKRKMFIPLQPDFCFAMEVADSASTPVIGSSYNITRVAAGYYELDATSSATPAVKIIGIYKPDEAIGLTLAPQTGTFVGIGAVTNRHAAVLVTAVGAVYN